MMAANAPRSGEIVVETERLTLRRFTDEDIDAVFTVIGDPLTRSFILRGSPVKMRNAGCSKARSAIRQTASAYLR